MLAVVGKVRDVIENLLGLGVEFAHDSAHRNFEHKVFSALAVATGALTVRSALSPKVVLKTVIDQRGKLSRSLNNDVAAVTTISAVRSALRDVCFTAERHTTGSAVSAFNVDAADIGEL